MATDTDTDTEGIMDTEVYKNSPIPEEEKIDFGTLIDDMWKGLERYWWLFLVIISVRNVLDYTASYVFLYF